MVAVSLVLGFCLKVVLKTMIQYTNEQNVKKLHVLLQELLLLMHNVVSKNVSCYKAFFSNIYCFICVKISKLNSKKIIIKLQITHLKPFSHVQYTFDFHIKSNPYFIKNSL
jgi:hypothetical protein